MKFAAAVSAELWRRGYAVICPHLNTYKFEKRYGLDPHNKEEWIALFDRFLTGDFEIISRCDALVMLPDWEDSRGATAEFVFARYLGKPIWVWPELPRDLNETD